ncbi:response regulator [Oscillibacter sp. GMB15532]|uniref:response regulator n=1 Tax=Oscillibacter sp. GMB15532 TaxID=3230022 RepID=UPI0034DFD2FF
MYSKIMVVNDSEDICEVVEVLRTNEGYAVIAADRGESALHLLNQCHDIDLIILDIMMPGRSACRSLRIG